MYDVIVIGGGPGGLSFAIHSEGLRTVILEEHQTIGRPVHCGECLSDLCMKKFNLKPPKNAIARAVKGIRIIFPGESQRKVTFSEKGYVLNKDVFEQYLADLAVKKDMEIKTGSRVVGIDREEGYWKVKIHGDGEKEVKGRIIVDASGYVQLTSTLLKLNQPSKKVIGIQYRMDDITMDDYLNFHLWPNLAPHGYLWMIPKSLEEKGLANVGLVTDDIKNAKQYLDKFITIKGWKNVKYSFGGMIPASGPLNKTYHTGILMVGDAAGFTSPLFEGGTHLAMMSGKLAAQVAKKAIEKNDYSQEVMKEYESLWKKEFPPYSSIVKGKKALYDKLSIEDLEKAGRLLPDSFDNFGFLEKIGLGVKILANQPELYKKNIIDALFAFAYSQAKYYGW